MTEPLWRRVLRLHGPDPRADVRDEFAFHLEQRAEALMAAGVPEADARAQARSQFGDLPGATAVCAEIGARRVRRLRWREWLGTLQQDLAYALKGMRRSPGFTVAAILTIALGIGANTAVFSLLNALLFQPLDAVRPAELVRVYTSEGRAPRESRDRFGGSSYADYADLRGSRSLAGLAAYMPVAATIQLPGGPSRFEGRIVSGNYFSLLGTPLLLGGWRDGQADATQVIVSHHLWATQLEGDSAIIGRSLMVNGRIVRVAGVTAPGFRGIEPTSVDLYLPFGAAPVFMARAGILTDRGERSLRLIGRLAPGLTPDVAERELGAVMHGLAAEFPASNAKREIAVRRAASIVPLELMGDRVIPTAGLVFGATLVMLAISGVNVAAVLLARTIKRRRELAVRLSLGASPLRLVRQLVTESVVLAMMAALLVIGLVSLLPLLASRLGVPRSVRPDMDLSVLGYAIAVALGSGLLFGLAPALIGVRSGVVAALRSGELDAHPVRARAQRLLVGAQLALCMLLLIVGSALLRSLDRQQRVDPGFVAAHLIVAQFEDASGMADIARERVFTRLAVERMSAIPGVTSVSLASMAPLTGNGMRSTIYIPGYAEGAQEDMEIAMVTAGPELFRTLGVPLRRGRELAWSVGDTLSKVVVNESMARRYWPGRDPVGSYVQLGGKGGTPAEVIGVAGDVRFISLSEAPVPMFVVQRSAGGGATLLVRSSGDADNMLTTVRGVMNRSDVPLTMVGLRTMDDVRHSSLAVTRAVTGVLMTIGALAVLLAAVGLYGVVSYVMQGRTREFGVRLALGASPASITKLVLGFGLRLTVIGGAVGTVLGLVAVRLMGRMLFETGRALPVVVVLGLGLCLVTLGACAVPALRAMASSPASALRAD